MAEQNFVNLTPYTVDVMNREGDVISSVAPSGTMALTVGDPPQLLNTPPPEDGTVYVVLPAITEVSDRPDLVSVEIDEAQRSRRGNVRTHVCYWPKEEPAE